MSNTSQSGDAPSDSAASGHEAAKIRVLVVDDQPLIRKGLAIILGTEPDIDVVGQAADGIEALDLSRQLKPDIVLMDLVMPRLGGVATTRKLTSESSTTQVVVLTTFDADDLVFDAIRAGAQAYLLKDASEAEVLDTIRAVHRGESRLSPHIARRVLQEFRRLPAVANSGRPSGTADNPPSAGREPTEATPGPDSLTKREEEILELLGQGKSNKEIARAIFLAEGTVKNYVSKIMEKLHARTRTELAIRVASGRKSWRSIG